MIALKRPRLAVQHWLYLLLSINLGFLIRFHATILQKFSFQWTDMDQVWMWYATLQMREGHWRMPRYWGQNYGSMLEAWLAVPFTGVDLHVLLPLISYSLMLIPFAFLVWKGGPEQQFQRGFVVLTFLALIPIEYVMICAKPHDMVSGIMVTSLALPFIRGHRMKHFILVGFFSLLGWSFNNNAALLGASLSLFMLFRESPMPWTNRLGWLAAGYGLGGLIHGSVWLFYQQHPKLIVHRLSHLVYSGKNLWEGLTHPGRHWGSITPILHEEGWFMLLLLAGLIAVGFRLQKRSIWIPTAALTIIVLTTLGIAKVHNATDSVFFSYERMFLALPICILFLFLELRLTFSRNELLALSAIVTVVLIHQPDQVSGTIQENLWDGRKHYLTTLEVSKLKAHCATLADLQRKHQAEAFFFGPDPVAGNWLISRGCPCLESNLELMVDPTYERKTWDLQRMDQPAYSRVLWITAPQYQNRLDNIQEAEVQQLDSLPPWQGVYLLTGSNFNPMQAYREAGFKSVSH